MGEAATSVPTGSDDSAGSGLTDILDTPAAGPAMIRGSLLQVSGYLVGMLLSILSVSLLYRHLGGPDYGHYAVVIALVTIVQGVTDIGLGQIGVREFALRHGDARVRLMRNLLGVRVALTTVGIGLGVAFAAAAGYGERLVFGTLLAGGGMVLTVIQGTFAVPLSAGLRLGWVTAMNLLRQVLTVAAIVLLVVLGAKLLAFLALTIPVAIIVLVATLVIVRNAMPLRPAFGLFTQPITCIGLPVLAVPVQNVDGSLPIGVQLIAAPWREDLLVRAAAVLEAQGICRALVAPAFQA